MKLIFAQDAFAHFIVNTEAMPPRGSGKIKREEFPEPVEATEPSGVSLKGQNWMSNIKQKLKPNQPGTYDIGTFLLIEGREKRYLDGLYVLENDGARYAKAHTYLAQARAQNVSADALAAPAVRAHQEAPQESVVDPRAPARKRGCLDAQPEKANKTQLTFAEKVFTIKEKFGLERGLVFDVVVQEENEAIGIEATGTISDQVDEFIRN